MKYGFIDSARGIAILMVIFVHVAEMVALPPSAFKVLSYYGQMGVQLFFVASALTLCLSFEHRKNEHNAMLNFYIRRFFRIAPVYYMGILGYFVLRVMVDYVNQGSLIVQEQYTLTNIFANIVFLHGLYMPANNNIVPGGWSIGTEMLFYLIFPVLMIAVSYFKRFKLFPYVLPVIAFLATSFTISFLLGHKINNNSFEYFSIVNQLSVFTLGISLHLFYANKNSGLLNIRSRWIATGFLAFSFLSIYIGWILDSEYAFALVPLLSGISFIFLIELLRRLDSVIFWPLQQIGKRSYSMYIIHFFFAHYVFKLINNVFLVDLIGPELSIIVSFVLSVIATFYLAGLTVRFVEVYFINMGKIIINWISTKNKQQVA